jgi:hypothetical protein
MLVTPYDSLGAVAQAKYPFILVDLLLKHPFDSVSWTPSIDAPLLALIAETDTLVPPRFAKHLVRRGEGPPLQSSSRTRAW